MERALQTSGNAGMDDRRQAQSGSDAERDCLRQRQRSAVLALPRRVPASNSVTMPFSERCSVRRSQNKRDNRPRGPSPPLAAISFERVYRRHAGFVRTVLNAMGMAASVDDALQDVFVVVHRRLREFDGKYSLRSWLYAIARRVASHYRRSQRRALVCESIEHDIPDRAAGPVELAEQRETLFELEAVFAEIDPAKRQLLLLADIEQRSVPEIAELTGTCLSTIYTRLRRARRSLQASAGWQQLLIQHELQQIDVTACVS